MSDSAGKKNNKAPQTLSDLEIDRSKIITTLRNTLRKYQKTNESIRAEAKKYQKDVQTLRTAHEGEINSLNAYIRNIQVETQELESKNLQLEKQSLKLEQINDELRDENQRLQEKAKRRKQSIYKLQEEIDDLNREIDELTEEVNDLKEENRKQRSTILELKPKNPSVKRKRSITDAYEKRQRRGVNVDLFKQLRI